MVMVRRKMKGVRKWLSVCDNRWEVPTVGHLGGSHGDNNILKILSRQHQRSMYTTTLWKRLEVESLISSNIHENNVNSRKRKTKMCDSV